jgi:hypothetical protein
MANSFEEKILELKRRGEINKAKWMENISKYVMESHKKRIQSNDKTVMQELVVPSWVSWELLREWATSSLSPGKKRCIICLEEEALGVEFKDKFLCYECFLGIKNLE